MEKIYCGSAKTITTQYGNIYKISFNKDDIKKLQENLSEKGWVNLNMIERKEVGKYGETHSISVDTWQPKEQKKSDKVKNEPVDDSDLPF